MSSMIGHFVIIMVVMWSIAQPGFALGRDEQATGPTLYRYKNDQGKVAVTQVLSPEIVLKGYDVVNMQGDVLKTIPPAPTEKEKQQLLQAIEQSKYDKTLLLKYATLAELMKAQKRGLGEMEAKLSVLASNQSNIKLQIEAEQAKAANYERQGNPVPEVILSTLEELYANLERTEDMIRKRTKEMEDERIRYEKELYRYKEIKGLK